MMSYSNSWIWPSLFPCSAGDVLIKQGDLGDAAYVVIKGEFEIQKQSGQSLIKIDMRNPGDVVGEMALLARTPRYCNRDIKDR